MQRRSDTPMRVFLRGCFLALLSLAALGPVHAQTAAFEPLAITGQGDVLSGSSSDSLLAGHVGLSRTIDVRAVLEDSDEMLRLDIEPRAIGTDLITIERKVWPKALRNLRPAISPPLLV